jgi:hypothetical protein
MNHSSVFADFVANYLPYVICGVLSIIYIWTLSDSADEYFDIGSMDDSQNNAY